jgi:hypothetical protein
MVYQVGVEAPRVRSIATLVIRGEVRRPARRATCRRWPDLRVVSGAARAFRGTLMIVAPRLVAA